MDGPELQDAQKERSWLEELLQEVTRMHTSEERKLLDGSNAAQLSHNHITNTNENATKYISLVFKGINI